MTIHRVCAFDRAARHDATGDGRGGRGKSGLPTDYRGARALRGAAGGFAPVRDSAAPN